MLRRHLQRIPGIDLGIQMTALTRIDHSQADHAAVAPVLIAERLRESRCPFECDLCFGVAPMGRIGDRIAETGVYALRDRLQGGR